MVVIRYESTWQQCRHFSYLAGLFHLSGMAWKIGGMDNQGCTKIQILEYMQVLPCAIRSTIHTYNVCQT